MQMKGEVEVVGNGSTNRNHFEWFITNSNGLLVISYY